MLKRVIRDDNVGTPVVELIERSDNLETRRGRLPNGRIRLDTDLPRDVEGVQHESWTAAKVDNSVRRSDPRLELEGVDLRPDGSVATLAGEVVNPILTEIPARHPAWGNV